MRSKANWIFASLLIIMSSGASLALAQKKLVPSKVDLTPCEVSGTQPKTTVRVLCGSYEVFENRATKSGRKIALKIVIFPVSGLDKKPDPLFYIPGGPGSSSTEDAPYVAEDLARVREHRDLVFVDQRGTGGSNPLNCTFFDAADPQTFLGHWNPPEQVRKCRTELEAKADLRLYTTTIAMDDLDEVREALGYKRINIIGGSYGTRATQEYVRTHARHVRSVILHGVSLTSQLMPRDFPQHTERAIDGVIGECLENQACHAAFPNLKTDKKTVLERLLAGPIDVDINYPEDSTTVRHVRLSRDLAAEAVRYMLYQSAGGSRVPLFLHEAASGNFRPLAQAALYYRQNLVGTGATGLYISVTCAEDLPWIEPGVGERNAVGTFLGDYRLRQQREACAEWPRGSIPKDYGSPVRSTVPALIMTGQWDPVTPPLYGEMAAKNFSKSLNIVVPSGGHGFAGLEGLDCINNLIADFVNRGSPKGLDTACVKTIHRSGFQLKFGNPGQ